MRVKWDTPARSGYHSRPRNGNPLTDVVGCQFRQEPPSSSLAAPDTTDPGVVSEMTRSVSEATPPARHCAGIPKEVRECVGGESGGGGLGSIASTTADGQTAQPTITNSLSLQCGLD